ncbi:MAG: hypothetical protein WCF98_03305 [Synechococcus sp. ELA057]
MTPRHLLAAAALTLWLAPLPPLWAKEQTKSAPPEPPPATVIQKLRAFLGLNPPVAIGGSRGTGGATVCLLSPWPGQPVGVLNPVIQAAGPLNEIRLERNGQLLWQQRASSEHAIEGPVAWPIEPLKPDEVLTLRLRPRGASGADFASFSLRVADASTLNANQARVMALGRDPQTWYAAIDGLPPADRSRLAALLSSPEAPSGLRHALGCTPLP